MANLVVRGFYGVVVVVAAATDTAGRISTYCPSFVVVVLFYDSFYSVVIDAVSIWIYTVEQLRESIRVRGRSG